MIINIFLLPVDAPSFLHFNTTATSISLSWASVGSEDVSYVVQWYRNVSVGCSDDDQGSTIVYGSTSYDIVGLEEDSSYLVFVSAHNALGYSEESITITAMTLEAGERDSRC